MTPIANRTRFGPYEIVGPLGAGGMGEVYRARDTRLGRDVAIKVLPQKGSISAEDRARFRREAKVISSLNHPHICVLYDIGQEGDTDYLVMELVEGETLARRIAKKPIPTSEALGMGAQIAEALDSAHRAGVVHRDLKPGNVMLTRSGVKLMDFGLARDIRRDERDPDGTVTDLAGAPDTKELITRHGTVVGTFQYMAPEQLESKPVDARCDLWALGCVLYEMATGRRAFEGSTAISVISAIMRDEPRRMTELAPMAPPAFERLVRQCLAKRPDDRWQTAGDLRRELLWIASSDEQVPKRTSWWRQKKWSMALPLVAAGIAGSALIAVLPREGRQSAPYMFELPPPKQVRTIGLPRVSPDGRTVAFNATDSSGRSALWLRAMNSTDAKRLEGTEGASRPFWSPDSRTIGFFARGKLQTVSINGGPPETVCPVALSGDGTWSQNGTILFDQTLSDDVQMVSSSGGVPKPAVTRDKSKHESGSAWPQFLPDGRHFLFLSFRDSSTAGNLKAGLLGSSKTWDLGPIPSRVEFSRGHLLYVRDNTLIARPFDAKALRFKGGPLAIAENVAADPSGQAADFSVGAEGTLVYHTGSSPYAERFVWVNRSGNRIGTVGGYGSYDVAGLSSDEKHLASSVGDAGNAARYIGLWDLSRGLESRITSKEDMISPVWSPDGTRLAFGRKRGEGYDMYVTTVTRSDDEALLYSSDEIKSPSDWSSDGQWLIYLATKTRGLVDDNWDIYALSMLDPTKRILLVGTRFFDAYAELSPDSKWLAYASHEGDHWESYVTAFRGEGDRWRISTDGGGRPTWRGDGREIYYLGNDGWLMAVSFEPGLVPRLSLPRRLFDTRIIERVFFRTAYMPSADGQRFLLIRPEEPNVGTTKVLLNWPQLVSK